MKRAHPLPLAAISAAAISAVVLVGLSGCAASTGAPHPSEATREQQGVADTAVVAPADPYALYEADGTRLLAQAEPPALDMEALLAGELARNDRGCFGVRTQGSERFVPVVFPYGTAVANADAISFKGREFPLGAVLAVGGGNVPLTAPDGSALAQALQGCGFGGEVFISGYELQLLSEFEAQMAETRDETP